MGVERVAQRHGHAFRGKRNIAAPQIRCKAVYRCAADERKRANPDVPAQEIPAAPGINPAHDRRRQAARFFAEHIVHGEACYQRPTICRHNSHKQKHRAKHKVSCAALESARNQLPIHFCFGVLFPCFQESPSLVQSVRKARPLVYAFLKVLSMQEEKTADRASAAGWCVNAGDRLCHVNKPCGHNNPAKYCTERNETNRCHAARLLSAKIGNAPRCIVACRQLECKPQNGRKLPWAE